MRLWQKYSGNFCEFVHGDNENFDGDFDGDQKIDSLDLDDDNDGIPDIFEVKYEGSYKGPWKPGEHKRTALCPRFKFNLECDENFNFSKRSNKIFIQMWLNIAYIGHIGHINWPKNLTSCDLEID